VPKFFYFLYVIFFYLSPQYSFGFEKKEEKKPLNTSLKAFVTIKKVKKLQRRLKNKLENKVKNIASVFFISEDLAKSFTGTALMVLRKELRMNYQDFKFRLDEDELFLSYKKGF
jgi:hypothetical protein